VEEADEAPVWKRLGPSHSNGVGSGVGASGPNTGARSRVGAGGARIRETKRSRRGRPDTSLSQ
jgi:hypothetical protein